MRPAAQSPLKQYPSVSTDIMSHRLRATAPDELPHVEPYPLPIRILCWIAGFAGSWALVIGLFSWVWRDWPL